MSPFKPALIVVDLQEDFCPPNGSLAVPGGRDVVPTINELLELPFALKIATKDWHPRDHISFASNHNDKKPFEDFATITNPSNADEKYESRLWPDHCIQDTPGASLIPELNHSKLTRIIEKGQLPSVEMYSAFYPPLKNPRIGDSGLAAYLREEGITHVYVVGLAFGHCVKATAIDAASEGFKSVIVGEGTKGVVAAAWEETTAECKEGGVDVVAMDGDEIKRVKELGQ